jgi:hypothetical protein
MKTIKTTLSWTEVIRVSMLRQKNRGNRFADRGVN